MNKKQLNNILKNYDEFPRLYILPRDFHELGNSVNFYDLGRYLFVPKELDENGFVGVLELGNELWFSVFEKV